jgi:hypothetical protein
MITFHDKARNAKRAVHRSPLVLGEVQPYKEVTRKERGQTRVKLPRMPNRLVMQWEEGSKVLLIELRICSDLAVR